MATHSKFPLKCSCGHTGAIAMSENDQPYSKCWEKYRVENFNSMRADVYVDGSISVDEAIARLSVTCPDCGASITHENLNRD